MVKWFLLKRYISKYVPKIILMCWWVQNVKNTFKNSKSSYFSELVLIISITEMYFSTWIVLEEKKGGENTNIPNNALVLLIFKYMALWFNNIYEGKSLKLVDWPFIICAWVFCLHACLSTTYFLGTWSSQKTVSDPLRLELQMIVKHHVGFGNQIQSLWKSKHYSVIIRPKN